MTVSIDHVGISVPNIEKAIDWYKQTFDIFKISEVMEVNAESDEIASDVFDNKFFDAVIDLVSYLEGGPAISAINKLEFGEPSVAPIPVDPDTNGVAPIECKRGICEFED